MSHSHKYPITLGIVAAVIIIAAVAIRFASHEGLPLAENNTNTNGSESPNVDESFLNGKKVDLTNTLPSTKPTAVGTSNGTSNGTADESRASRITAKAYLIGNVKTGEIISSLNAYQTLPVASMSKLITAMAVIYSLSPTTTVEISKEQADLPPDGSNLKAGEKFQVSELLYPMLLDSSNVAAEALASSTNRPDFLYLMSGYAHEIGMPDTYFADASGLDPLNVASARDIFTLARYLYSDHQDILALTRTAHNEVATTSDHGAHSFDSIHPFVHDPRFLGGKTGRTRAAGETMLTILNINETPIAFIVLGSKIGARESDTRLLIEGYR